jgi:tetratricopeptide (TPR) repeat protein
VRPITLLARKTKAVWNILNQTGHRSLVVGWWPSHPAEPINGAMVSNLFTRPVGKPDDMPPLAPGTVHPPALAQTLGELRVNPMELDGEFLRLFVPEFAKVDQATDKRLHSLGKIIAETMSIHAAGTELLATQAWDFAAVYYTGLDHFGHAFMRYHPPRMAGVSEADFSIYQQVMANAYRYHDAMLGTLLGYADENTTVILMSDHGFHSDHLRPGYIPAEAAGPAVEHRHFGILCMKGPGLKVNQPIYGAGLLDICPTLLALFGLPPGKDMDGKVLSTAFKDPAPVQPIESWDAVEGDAGTHSPEARLDPVASAEAFKQLVDLGYVAPPAENVPETIDECVRELRYNVARAYLDGNCYGEAAALAEELWTRWPREHRFGILLIESLGPLRQVARRRAAVEELGKRIERYQTEAKVELRRLEELKAQEPKPATSPAGDTDKRKQFEERQWRELAFGRPLLMEWFWLSQALLEKKPAEARPYLEKLAAADRLTDGMNQRVASALVELGDLETARALLEESLLSDPDNALVQSQLAGIHFKAGQFDETIRRATESLSLLYFQPNVHALLGKALLEKKRFAEAEQELKVAVSQSPRQLVAHELLAGLYRQHLNRPTEAFAHEGRARSLRMELTAQTRAGAVPGEAVVVAPSEIPGVMECEPARISTAAPDSDVPLRFEGSVEAGEIITVVSGLPRSGTSMMMQLLVAAGRPALTDARRVADEDNPRGYFELDATLGLARDASWVPEARGKVVKVVAQLLPFLPRDQHYQVIFMERNLQEVAASQKVMLARQGRKGADLEEEKLLETYRTQVQRVRGQLAKRPEFRILDVKYEELLADPVGGVSRLAEFLGEPFEQKAAVESVRPELRRQKYEIRTDESYGGPSGGMGLV